MWQHFDISIIVVVSNPVGAARRSRIGLAVVTVLDWFDRGGALVLVDVALAPHEVTVAELAAILHNIIINYRKKGLQLRGA